jgi:hypothetical protein
MTVSLVSTSGVLALFAAAFVVSFVVRRVIRGLVRRAVRRGAERPGTWRVRLRRLGDLDTEIENRKRQRADASARMFGHVVTALLFVTATLLALHLVGVDPVYAISSAGFVGLAVALSAQDLVRNLIAGTVALLEDRYAVGDEVTVRVSGTELRGVIDLAGAASLRLRGEHGETVHVGHAAIESVVNHSQLPASAEIGVATDRWTDVEDAASQRLAAASNDVGLTGVVFLPELTAQPHPAGMTTVTVKSNRPLTDDQKSLVRDRLIGGAEPS